MLLAFSGPADFHTQRATPIYRQADINLRLTILLPMLLFPVQTLSVPTLALMAITRPSRGTRISTAICRREQATAVRGTGKTLAIRVRHSQSRLFSSIS